MNQMLLYNDELTLIQRFKADDANAFQFIYDIHYHPLYHFADRFIKDSEQAKDIIAESFVVLWEKRLEFITYKGITGFLYTVVRNACYDYLKKIKRRAASNNEIAYLFGNKEFSEMTEAIKTDLIQYSLIEGTKLPRQMRKIFQLLYTEGFSAIEIAEKLNLSVHTVRVQKVNAIRRVRENLTKKGLLSWLF